MNRGRVEEERGGKETDGCPLTVMPRLSFNSFCVGTINRGGSVVSKNLH
jgi:hypothetical protein